MFLVAAAAVACTEISTNPSTPVSVAFDTLAAPAVVVGDTLRDINGVAARLHPIAYNSSGKPLTDAAFTFLVGDTTKSLTVSPEGYVIALKGRATPVPVVAKLSGLPDVQKLVYITSRPDSVDPIAASLDTLKFFANDTALFTPENLVVVLHDSVVGTSHTFTPVTRYLVQFSIERAAPAVAARVDFVTPQLTQTSIDTSEATGGAAGRRIRVVPDFSKAPNRAIDSVVVQATVRYRGQVVPGGRVVVPVCFAEPAAGGSGRACVR